MTAFRLARRGVGARSFTWMVMLAVAQVLGASGTFATDPERATTVVTVPGTILAPLHATPIADFFLFRYNPGAGAFEPVPFQVDERFLKVFDAGLPTQFSEMVYDVFGQDDGLFDVDDEIVFLFGDAGPRAPLDGSWVAGASETRFEIMVVDPRPVNPDPPRWAYLFTGPGLPTSPASYVSWNGQSAASITTDSFRLDFDGNWLMTGLTVFSPCGSGADLLDRFKGRADPGTGLPRQDEEDWNANSTYLGGLTGPVRAIRYVRGARSGVNTILRDIVEPGAWARRVNLRVHPVAAAWVYFDWLPEPGATLYTETHPSGIPIDGVPDAGISTTYVPWHLVGTPAGGMFVSWDVPESPLYTTRSFYYIDDASLNDIVPPKTSYSDDDDSAYGDHGVKIAGTLDSNVNPIRIAFRALPLCSGQGDLDLALALQEKVDLPLVPDAVPQANCGAVRTLGVALDGADVRLDWQAEPQADGYRIYSSASASLDRSLWTIAGETLSPTFTDPGGASGADRVYSVVCTRAGAEGPW